MKNCGFKCDITNKRFDDIHHLTAFNIILYESLNNLSLEIKENISDYTKDELVNICEECKKNNYKYGLGICLTKEEHENFHKIYGYGNNTKEQYLEYKKID